MGRRTGQGVEEGDELKMAIHLSITLLDPEVLLRGMAGVSHLPPRFYTGFSLASSIWSHSRMGHLGNSVPAYEVDNSHVSGRISRATPPTPDSDQGTGPGPLCFCFCLFVFIYSLIFSNMGDYLLLVYSKCYVILR